MYGYLTKPFDSRVLLDKVQQALNLGSAGSTTPVRHADDSWRSAIVSRSSRMAELLEETRMVASSDASILIRGRERVGQELLARDSPRQSAWCRAFRGDQLRGDSGAAARVGTVRPYQGRVYRSVKLA